MRSNVSFARTSGVVRPQPPEAVTLRYRTSDEQKITRRTHNPPTAKIEMRAIFCRRPRFKLRMTGIGNMIIAKSVTMFIAALVLHVA
jgi:hypothetical protein